jgi:predicted DCC family thiol-disulfide oxidoreductase YuxK
VPNGWSGGQYSAFRAVFAIYLGIHFAQLIPWAPELASSAGALPRAEASPLIHAFPNVLALWDAPGFAVALVVSGAAASALLLVGWGDRAAALWMWYVLAALHGRNPLMANPSLPFVGWMLLAHALLPPAPYGSVRAAGRVDPGAGWRMPPAIFAAAWVVLALSYSYSGYTKFGSPSWLDGSALRDVLHNPLARPTWLREQLVSGPAWIPRLGTWEALALELGFAPLALIRPLRPWLWTAALLLNLGLLVLLDFADLTLGMLLIHAFTFDPAWIRAARAGAEAETVFYDGQCGLCHRYVRFLLAEDARSAFRFAPLQGETFAAALPARQRAGLPDSIVVFTGTGECLVRSRALVHALARLGGLWRVLGWALAALPPRAADAAYDWIALRRKRWFPTPAELCPLLPARLRGRFLA